MNNQAHNCPACGGHLELVKQGRDSMLNAEQFDAVKLGDWFCGSCPPNRGGNYCYWWDREVIAAKAQPPAQADRIFVIRSKGRVIDVCRARPLAHELPGCDVVEYVAVSQAPEQSEPSTPAAKWREDGEPDPHGKEYDCERAQLAKGHLTDDELANALFICDHRTSLESIGYLTAAKDRIRWLSRRLCAQPEPSPDTEQPERTGVGQWCAPGPAAPQRRAWMLRFEDNDRGDAVLYDEQEARGMFANAEAHGWNCHLFAHAPRSGDTEQQRRDALRADIINTPELVNFSEAIRLEALHQRERWGSQHDDGKEPEDWLWLLAYLATKAAQAARYGDSEKYIHHIITCGAACLNWHAGATGTDTSMRVGPPIPAFEAAIEAEGKA